MFVLGVLHDLILSGILTIGVTHDGLHRCRGTIRSSKRISDVVDVNGFDGVLLFNGELARSPNPHAVVLDLSHHVLSDAGGNFVGSRQFVKSLEILVVNFWCLQGLLLIDPLRSH